MFGELLILHFLALQTSYAATRPQTTKPAYAATRPQTTKPKSESNPNVSNEVDVPNMICSTSTNRRVRKVRVPNVSNEVDNPNINQASSDAAIRSSSE